MPRISAFYGILIYMYYKEHNPPHFHAHYGEHKAEIGINDFALFRRQFAAQSACASGRMGNNSSGRTQGKLEEG